MPPPPVFSSARPIGIIKPEFIHQQGRVFADKLNILGTGFWIKDTDLIVTCAHVVEGVVKAPVPIAGLLVIGMSQGGFQKTIVRVLDWAHNLAVLRLDGPAQMIAIEAANGLEIASAYPNVGDAIEYAGFPLGEELLTGNFEATFADGVVGNPMRQVNEMKTIQLTGPVVGGFSGSPVAKRDAPNKIIGMVSHSTSERAGAAGIHRIVAWEHIDALVKLASTSPLPTM